MFYNRAFFPCVLLSPSLLLQKFEIRTMFALCTSIPIWTKFFPRLFLIPNFSSNSPPGPWPRSRPTQRPSSLGDGRRCSPTSRPWCGQTAPMGETTTCQSTPHSTSWPSVGHFVPVCLWRTRHPMFAELAGGSFGFEPNAEGIFFDSVPQDNTSSKL